ncbi:hypothetical protein C5N14_13705 [Micromonospora sp. MW-13]|uniref:hypothetical protein n=1 Tax=Micromonospora sp. MW-13 TaxID=2094022 RepID=UPI000E436393|nr:hypothetical protein [Micromonospora sp. MW-13]RGC68437.1 hypothetical protein C5N14_13705 [Micromonospora sp. MW-13]
MTPHHLHALAALHSVGPARARLAQLVRAETRQATAKLLAAAPALRSPNYGTRTSVGDHGDPTGGLVLDERPVRDTTWAELDHRLTGKLGWLADTIRATPGPDPWWRIYDALPRLQPGTARVVHRHLVDEDTWVRAAVGLGPDREPLPGVACPHCGERQLVVQTAGPVDAWTVVCATGRLCTGQGCPCGMEGAVEGAAHIWPRAAVIGAVAGAAHAAERG